MRTNTFFLLLLLFPILLSAQTRTVLFDYEKSQFDGGAPLPAEKKFAITGPVGSSIQLVEVDLHKAGSEKLIYRSSWRRSFTSGADLFHSTFNYKLKGNTEYDLSVGYFRYVTEKESEELKSVLFQTLDAYLDGSIIQDKKQIQLSQSPNQIVAALNKIVYSGMDLYRTANLEEFEGFSDLVKNKLKELKSTKLKKAKFLFGGEKDNKQDDRLRYSQELREDLTTLIRTEVDQYVNGDLMVLIDRKKIESYITEKTLNFVAVNVGYGAVYTDRTYGEFTYDTSPFAGLSFPFANAQLGSAFWRNTSLSVGVFFQNFEDGDGNEVTGPFIGRPYYVGLGYRVFRFIRLNVGATLLEQRDSNNGNGNGGTGARRVFVAPFVGASAELNLWIGFPSKN